MLKKGARGGWDDPFARATRGRGLPSLDARSWDHPSHPLVSGRSVRLCWTAFLSILKLSLSREGEESEDPCWTRAVNDNLAAPSEKGKNLKAFVGRAGRQNSLRNVACPIFFAMNPWNRWQRQTEINVEKSPVNPVLSTWSRTLALFLNVSCPQSDFHVLYASQDFPSCFVFDMLLNDVVTASRYVLSRAVPSKSITQTSWTNQSAK